MQTTIHNTFGVLYLAVVLSASLYGVGLLQFWLYIRKYHSQDPMGVKALVVTVLICDTCQQGLLCHALYLYLVTSMEDPSLLVSAVRTVLIQVFFSCAIATLVQQFYCWRIYKIGKSLVLAGAVSLLSWTTCATLLVYAVKLVQVSLLSEVISLKAVGMAATTLSTVVDFTISIVLVILLQSAKTGFKRSTDMLNRLMMFSFNTGLPTTLCAILDNIFLGIFPNTFIYIFFFLLMGRLYTNSLLVTLNCRDYIRSAQREEYSLEDSGRPRMPTASSRRSAIAIRIESDTINDFRAASPDLKNASRA
ncbi:hypothetical protein C8R47DRAFT_128585 [Mycena vitilis]|nr:hypothetical protein C8R47DRAFT_128585 [Mycena vitilis]